MTAMLSRGNRCQIDTERQLLSVLCLRDVSQDQWRAYLLQVGDYVKGQREGYGVYVFPNGDRYEGECSGDLPNGHGVYSFQVSGAICEGTWRTGAKHGYFVITVGCKQSCGAYPMPCCRC